MPNKHWTWDQVVTSDIDGLFFFDWVCEFGANAYFGRGSSQEALTYTIENLETSQSYSGNIPSSSGGLGFRENFAKVSLGIGRYKITYSRDPGFDGVSGIFVRVRRTHYPSVQGEPLKVLSQDYKTTEQRQATAEDFEKLRVI